tara:strand:+ start:1760 stop:2473 length:714 start_codon:yes stop_codon:yes gene_type:complete
MAKGGDLLGEVLGTQLFEQYSSKFFLGALNRKFEIEEALEETFSKFFDEMASMVGGQSVPKELSTFWLPLQEDWKLRKFKVGASSTPDENNFYRGISSDADSYRTSLASHDPIEAFGSPTVTIGGVKAFGNFKQKGQISRQRINLDKVNTKGNILRYNGRFAAIDSVFNVKLGYEAFPKVEDKDSLLSALSGRAAEITEYNEGLWTAAKAPRPFLVPMMEYYTNVKLKDAFLRSAQS